MDFITALQFGPRFGGRDVGVGAVGEKLGRHRARVAGGVFGHWPGVGTANMTLILKLTKLQVASLGIGLVLGLLYRAATVPPIDFAEWVFAGFFGLALGLVASGVYDLGVNFAARSAGNGGK